MIALDTETTGLMRPGATELHLQPFIIEFCAIKFNEAYEVVDKLSTFIKPPVPVPDEVIKITGITNDMLVGAPRFPEVFDSIVDFFLGERLLFAHNCAFDTSMILTELKRMGMEYKFPWPPVQICTVEASKCIQNKRLKLGQLYEIATGKPEIKNAHRAEADVLAMIECIRFLKENDFICFA